MSSQIYIANTPPRPTTVSQRSSRLISLERSPEDDDVVLLEIGVMLDVDLPPEELEVLIDVDLVLDKIGLVLDELELLPNPPLEPEPLAMYGQGLHSLYESPHVFPNRHVQAKPRTGSRGQVCMAVHVLLPESDPVPEPDDCIIHDHQS
jgi:hypothetical protein